MKIFNLQKLLFFAKQIFYQLIKFEKEIYYFPPAYPMYVS